MRDTYWVQLHAVEADLAGMVDLFPDDSDNVVEALSKQRAEHLHQLGVIVESEKETGP